jgi:hypothetical protein
MSGDRHRARSSNLHPVKGMATMGDRSPKSVQKQASQKQAKSDRADARKRQEVVAKQAAGQKK